MVSVVISTYNSGNSLELCLGSIANQSYDDIEANDHQLMKWELSAGCGRLNKELEKSENVNTF